MLTLSKTMDTLGTRLGALLWRGGGWAGLSYTGSEIIKVYETKEQSEHNNT